VHVRTICLAILSEGETTGYDIRKMSTEGEYSYFVDASYGSIYPALAKLEQDGLVTSRVEPHPGKPSRKVYSITEAGRQEFIDTLFEPLADDEFRCEFLMFARFAHELPAELVEKRICERVSALDEHIGRLEDLKDKRTSATETWILNLGIDSLSHHRTYLNKHRQELVELAQPARARAAE
jgi:DNA-binding PadR family transcriptional regulator